MKPVAWLLIALLLVVIFGFMGWALYDTGDLGSLTGGSGFITAMIVAAVVVTGAVAWGLMHLAFYSSKKGFDDQLQFEKRERSDDEA